MVKRKRDHLPRKQVDPVQDLFDVLMLASKVSSTGLTPAQCPFFPCSLPSHFRLTSIFVEKKPALPMTTVSNDKGIY
jgi:hypothetical protein